MKRPLADSRRWSLEMRRRHLREARAGANAEDARPTDTDDEPYDRKNTDPKPRRLIGGCVGDVDDEGRVVLLCHAPSSNTMN
jgi:hypothetical protein